MARSGHAGDHGAQAWTEPRLPRALASSWLPSPGADGTREGARLWPHGESHIASWQQGWAELDEGTAGDRDGEPQVPGGGKD